jgi:hypothetical protein
MPKYKRRSFKCVCDAVFTVESDVDFKVYCPRCGRRVKKSVEETEHEDTETEREYPCDFESGTAD